MSVVLMLMSGAESGWFWIIKSHFMTSWSDYFSIKKWCLHTSFLHKAKQIIQELFPLWFIIQFIELQMEKKHKQREYVNRALLQVIKQYWTTVSVILPIFNLLCIATILVAYVFKLTKTSIKEDFYFKLYMKYMVVTKQAHYTTDKRLKDLIDNTCHIICQKGQAI